MIIKENMNLCLDFSLYYNDVDETEPGDSWCEDGKINCFYKLEIHLRTDRHKLAF